MFWIRALKLPQRICETNLNTYHLLLIDLCIHRVPRKFISDLFEAFFVALDHAQDRGLLL